ncbi:Sugar transport protein 5 [Sesbania bispinosa]|nr:Sugar transport protein 5 [Sesbania bispinosa]
MDAALPAHLEIAHLDIAPVLKLLSRGNPPLALATTAEVNMYCVYDSQVLTLFTSLYLAGLVYLLASRVTAALGRRSTIMLGGAINRGSEKIVGSTLFHGGREQFCSTAATALARSR